MLPWNNVRQQWNNGYVHWKNDSLQSNNIRVHWNNGSLQSNNGSKHWNNDSLQSNNKCWWYIILGSNLNLDGVIVDAILKPKT